MTTPSTATPLLQTALSGPLLPLEKIFLEKHILIEAWFRQQFQKTPPPFYASVDLRNEGFKIAPIDTNLFPAGFNNLSPDLMPLMIQAAANTLTHYYPCCQRLLLVPENHTRNPYYWMSLGVLVEVLIHAGYEVKVGSTEKLDQSVRLSTGEVLKVELITRKDNVLSVGDFTPCAILLNHDLSEGVPDLLKNIEQPFIPDIRLGWHYRLKSQHFSLYQQVSTEFSTLFNLDPWLIDPLFTHCDNVDFSQNQENAELKTLCDDLLKAIQKKYDEYKIDKKPYLIVKADSGTYGLGVMTVHSLDDLNLNRKQRNKMSTSKGGQSINRVLIQEGVYTEETVGTDNAAAEPVVYMIGSQVVGGFYRIHKDKGANDNLNSPGMVFEPLAFPGACNCPNVNLGPMEAANRFYVYSVIARLALVAASREIQAVGT